MSQPLTGAINALTTYANSVTGASDTTLSDAVESLADGYGGGGGDDLLAKRLNDTLVEYYSEEVTKVPDSAFFGSANLEKISLPNCTSIATNSFNWSSKIKKASFPRITSMGNTALAHLSALEVVDIGKSWNISTNGLQACSSLTAIIIRKTDGLVAISANSLADSSFKNGGAGGTIYIPETYYNHLGDGTSSDYKAASNWSTYDGYGTITWAKLEGSIYESVNWLQF